MTWTYRDIPGGLFEVLGEDGFPVLRIRGGMSPVPAHARLIAAAPDLLAALVAVRGELDQMIGQWTERMDTLAQMADAAIAKAKGTA